MDDSDRLFDWLRFYAAFIGIAVLCGAVTGLASRELSPRRAEAAVIVVAKSGHFLPNQFQLLSEAVFRSARVYQPVLSELGMRKSPHQFLSEDVEVLPIPNTTAVIIVARADSEDTGRALAMAMTASFIQAFEKRTDVQLETFGRPTATLRPSGLSSSVAIAVGAACGLWLALALSTLHYRARRPVLSLDTAFSLSGASSIKIVPGRGWRWLGILRPNPLPHRSTNSDLVSGSAATLAAHAATPTRELLRPRSGEPSSGGLKLLWGR